MSALVRWFDDRRRANALNRGMVCMSVQPRTEVDRTAAVRTVGIRARARYRRTVAALVAGALAGIAALAGAGGAAAAPDPFYAHGPGGKPLGSIIAIEPLSAPAVAKKVSGVRAYRMLYVTSDVHGGRDVASASFFVPSTTPKSGKRALIGIGVADESLGVYCRPTSSLARNNALDSYRNSGPVDSASKALAAGHAVLVADLANDGGTAPTSTLVPRYDGTALLDGLRAALKVKNSGLNSTTTIGIYGPSGGGSQAAAVAAEIGSEYAPELKIPSIMIGQIVPDHRNFIKQNNGKVGSGFAFADLLGLEVAHPEMRINEKLTPIGRQIADAFRTGCTIPTDMSLGFVPLETLFKPGHSPYADPDFQAAFAQSALATPSSPTPTAALRMTRCTDNLSPVSVTPVDDLAKAAKNYKAAGANVDTRTVDCLATIGDPYGPDLEWLLARV